MIRCRSCGSEGYSMNSVCDYCYAQYEEARKTIAELKKAQNKVLDSFLKITPEDNCEGGAVTDKCWEKIHGASKCGCSD